MINALFADINEKVFYSLIEELLNAELGIIYSGNKSATDYDLTGYNFENKNDSYGVEIMFFKQFGFGRFREKLLSIEKITKTHSVKNVVIITPEIIPFPYKDHVFEILGYGGGPLVHCYDGIDLEKKLLNYPGIREKYVSGYNQLTQEFFPKVLSVSESDRQAFIINEFKRYQDAIENGGPVLAGSGFEKGFEAKAFSLLHPDYREEIIAYNYPFDWYRDPVKVPNQDLIDRTAAFAAAERPFEFEPQFYLNLIAKQTDNIINYLGFPDDYLQHLLSLPLKQIQFHSLLGAIIFWHGGYPVNNHNEQYDQLLKKVEKEFLEMFPGIETPEKRYFRVDAVRTERMKNHEEHLNHLLTHPEVTVNTESRESIPLILPTYPLDDSSRFWLQALYDLFMNGKEVDVASLYSTMYDRLDRKFRPEDFDPTLAWGGREITPMGLWQINSKSDVFYDIDRVIYAIQRIFKRGEIKQQILAKDIVAEGVRITPEAISRAFSMIARLNLTNGQGKKDNLIDQITVSANDLYRKYLGYEGLQSLLNETYRFNPNVKARPLTKININRTDYRIRHHDDFEAVMGVQSLAVDLADIVNKLRNEKGQMVGIFGRWGRGKTFLLQELWKVLKVTTPLAYSKVEYQAWKYQETPASWAYLYEVLTDGYLNAKGNSTWKWWNRQRRLIWLNLKRNTVWKNLYYVFAALFMAVIPLMAANIAEQLDIPVVYFIFGAITFDLTWLVTLSSKWAPKAKDFIKKYSEKHSFKQLLGLQAEIQKEIVILLKAWISDTEIDKKRIILFVEDIDRCTEERIIQNVDALRLILEDNEVSKRLIIVVAVDERILKDAVAHKYKKAETVVNEIPKLVTEYLDKLFLFAIKLGNLSTMQKEEFMKELLRNETDTSSWKIEEDLVEPAGGTSSETDSHQRNLETRSSKTSSLIEEHDASFKETISQPVTEHPRNPDASARVTNLLTFHEVKTFKRLISDWEDITPRQLRIFYYRYLFLKHLLLKYYESLPETNPWTTAEAVDGLVIFLQRYSGLTGQEHLANDKITVSTAPPEAYVPLISTHSDQMFQRNDLHILFHCIDLVVAY